MRFIINYCKITLFLSRKSYLENVLHTTYLLYGKCEEYSMIVNIKI